MKNASIKQIVVKFQVHPRNPIVLVFIAGLTVDWTWAGNVHSQLLWMSGLGHSENHCQRN